MKIFACCCPFFLSQVRRNCSNIACDDMGRVILEDISARSVSRSEVKAGASLQASCKMHFEQMKEDISEMDPTCSAMCFYGYRQDATNDKKKRSTLELDSSYVIFETNGPPPSLKDSSVKLHRLSDVLPITDETAGGTVGSLWVARLGMHAWKSCQRNSFESVLFSRFLFVFDFLGRQCSAGPRPIDLWLYTIVDC